MGKAYQPREQRYTFLSVCSILCVQQWYGCQCLGFLTWAQILMRAIAHGAVPGRTLQESLFWKLTQGEKISVLRHGGLGRTPVSIAAMAFRLFSRTL